jgi:hypothetical protein
MAPRSIPVAAVVLFLSSVFGQPTRTTATVYFLRDDSHGRWCGYRSESQLRDEARPLGGSPVVGEVDYVNGRVSAVRVSQTDETGDWVVNDEYVVGGNGKLERLKRTINIFPEDHSEEQVFLLSDGKATTQSDTHRELRTGKSTRDKVDWFTPPPVVRSLRAFPFFALVERHGFVFQMEPPASLKPQVPTERPMHPVTL